MIDERGLPLPGDDDLFAQPVELLADGHLTAQGLFAYSEELLSAEERRQARTHLDSCLRCRKALSQEQVLTVSLRQLELAPPPDVSVAVGLALRADRALLRSRRAWWLTAVALLVMSGAGWLVAGLSPSQVAATMLNALVLVPQRLLGLAEDLADGSLLRGAGAAFEGFGQALTGSPAALLLVVACFLLVVTAINYTLWFGLRRLLEVRR